jgi:hypothetical protein
VRLCASRSDHAWDQRAKSAIGANSPMIPRLHLFPTPRMNMRPREARPFRADEPRRQPVEALRDAHVCGVTVISRPFGAGVGGLLRSRHRAAIGNRHRCRHGDRNLPGTALPDAGGGRAPLHSGFDCWAGRACRAPMRRPPSVRDAHGDLADCKLGPRARTAEPETGGTVTCRRDSALMFRALLVSPSQLVVDHSRDWARHRCRYSTKSIRPAVSSAPADSSAAVSTIP